MLHLRLSHALSFLSLSLSFHPLFHRYSYQSSFISNSFHPRLSSRAQSAVTKIDFLARTRERAGEIEYIAVENPVSTSRFRPTRAVIYIRFIRFSLLLALFRRRFRKPRQIFHAIDKKKKKKHASLVAPRWFAAFSPTGPVDVIESDIDGWYENALPPRYIDGIHCASVRNVYLEVTSSILLHSSTLILAFYLS